MTLREILQVGYRLIRFSKQICTTQVIVDNKLEVKVRHSDGTYSTTSFNLDESPHYAMEFTLRIGYSEELVQQLHLSNVVPLEKHLIKENTYRGDAL